MLSGVGETRRVNSRIAVNAHCGIFDHGVSLVVLGYRTQQVSFAASLSFKGPRLKIVGDDRSNGGGVTLSATHL
jgi:hypothetical protein